MTTIKAHFDGRVFVPDEPVEFPPGQSVVVQKWGETRTGEGRTGSAGYLHKLDIHLDARLLREIVDDPELGIENT